MKKNFTLLCALFIFSANAFSQSEKKITFEAKLGAPYIEIGAYKNLDKKQMIGAKIMSMGLSQHIVSWGGGMSIISPTLCFSPTYQYYLNGFQREEEKKWKGSWVVSAELNVPVFVKSPLEKEDWGIYLTPGIGYDFTFNHFFVRPCVKLAIPLKQIYNQDNYVSDLWAVSSIYSAISTISVGYRF